ncbi:MAG: hypothetical protein K8R60_08800 [Burkholderiales bacterium]|nr:hypothetical protein [Burkholderiales bacterium]
MTELATTEDTLRSNKTLTWILYGLYGASFLVGITSIVAIILNYVKRGDVAGTYLESHFTWQIRTFWISLVVAIIGVVLMIVLVGWLVLLADMVWVIYRLVIGAVKLNENKPIVEGKFGLAA